MIHDVNPSLRIFLLVFFYALFYAFFMTRPLLFLDPVRCTSCGWGRLWRSYWGRDIFLERISDWKRRGVLSRQLFIPNPLWGQRCLTWCCYVIGINASPIRPRPMKPCKMKQAVICSSKMGKWKDPMAERAGVKKQSGKNEVVDLRTLSI